jgi:hypothetical protein
VSDGNLTVRLLALGGGGPKGGAMSDNPRLREARPLPDGLTLELWGGDTPALVLAQGENRVRVELARVKGLVAALTDAAADLAEVLPAGGVYHA